MAAPLSNPSSSPSSPASTTSDLPHPRIFPHNPSVGLRLLAPIVPASDNKPALFFLSTMQLLGGMALMARRGTPTFPTYPAWRRRISATIRFVSGSALVLMSGLEYTRMLLPHDPWLDEARHWRQWAIKNGHRPSWWFGAISFYTPMSMDEWKARSVIWVKNTANALESRESPGASEESGDLLAVPLGPRARLKNADPAVYADIYANLRNINAAKARELLQGQLASVTEVNKAARLDALLEGNSSVEINPEYAKPNIQLGSHSISSDDDFDMVWANFEPWDELATETDFDIRFVPRSDGA